ncbi:MAG: biotin--[acetyl-CoA-carboxylase] ligase [Deltaproteobacteria bacterium]
MKSDDHGMSQIERTLIEKGFSRQRRVLYLPETDSTNDDAARMAAKGAAAGSIVIAREQRRGRGRIGKKWLSLPGNGLTFSYIARPEVKIGEVPRLTLAAGLAVANAIEAQTGLVTTIKWPNDILINGRKVAGLLCEFQGENLP